MGGSRVLDEAEIAAAVEELAEQASFELPPDVVDALGRALESESKPLARYALRMILENARIAAEERLPLCQDTGLFHLFIDLGEGVALPASFREAANRALAAATAKFALRSSVVDDPLSARRDRGDNTPLLFHLGEGAPAGKARLTLLAKGGGSENSTRLCMLLPGDGAEGLKEAVLGTVKEKAAQTCPPLVVGVGVGSDGKGALELAAASLLRPLGRRNPRGFLADLEEELLQSINGLGVGAAGLGGDITALDVHLEEAPTHMACLPVGIAFCCHSLRRAAKEI